jgi:hypothetical protein
VLLPADGNEGNRWSRGDSASARHAHVVRGEVLVVTSLTRTETSVETNINTQSSACYVAWHTCGVGRSGMTGVCVGRSESSDDSVLSICDDTLSETSGGFCIANIKGTRLRRRARVRGCLLVVLHCCNPHGALPVVNIAGASLGLVWPALCWSARTDCHRCAVCHL